ncbi:hypothetical protein KEM48_002998 [Puccinia striiformis f. sp. tritici PST-130]|uniref:Uncharacterized protein n=1 Tax=Puccinia striiformis f. sp. tritici PST-78 TaxID=1165861 RepID=A0A0L0V2M7_9BASI|nr:hypothetical protein KEM48_002998 [Puccinia striiformis f. sp. tritici PST-130]KNE93543.1 hypothetical protein PSTG_13076 [Puccinia striiformis f. sp. tritici PST-78]
MNQREIAELYTTISILCDSGLNMVTGSEASVHRSNSSIHQSKELPVSLKRSVDEIMGRVKNEMVGNDPRPRRTPISGTARTMPRSTSLRGWAWIRQWAQSIPLRQQQAKGKKMRMRNLIPSFFDSTKSIHSLQQ